MIKNKLIVEKSENLKQFGNRLKLARINKDFTQEELAEKIGTSKSVISGYESGKNDPGQTVILNLSRILNVSVNYLMGVAEDDIFNIPNVLKIKPSTKKIPLLGTIAAGTPILAEENIEDYIDLDKEIQADFCLRIKGDSMVNANIYSGDIVFINKQNDVDDGDIAAILINDEATLKRVYKIGGVVQLRAENPKYQPITLNGDKQVFILGKATYKISEVL